MINIECIKGPWVKLVNIVQGMVQHFGYYLLIASNWLGQQKTFVTVILLYFLMILHP